MPSQVDVVLVIVGCVLLATGLLGGGFEMISVKVPKVGGALPRLFASAAGAFCILLGTGVWLADLGSHMTSVNDPSPSPAPSVSSAGSQPSPSPQITFLIKDEVGDCQTPQREPLPQTAEKVEVTIGNQYVGSVFVNRGSHPSDEIKVTVPRVGVYKYSLQAIGDFEYQGNTFELTGAGEGNLRLADGGTQRFLVHGSCPAASDAPYNVYLDEIFISS